MCVFKNTDQKNICTSIVFKAESRPKQEEKICKDFIFAESSTIYILKCNDLQSLETNLLKGACCEFL